MALGGVRTRAEIRGHRRTYIGSSAGLSDPEDDQVSACATRCSSLDEIDKDGQRHARGSCLSALLEVLDPEQNHVTSTDHYLEVDYYDLSDVLMFFFCMRSDEHPGAPAGSDGSHPPAGLHRGREGQHQHLKYLIPSSVPRPTA
ncbi:hypothetical protein P4123_19975 [Pseudomonas aeruginosa]|nr:hypothetical protein [Pseudomonas aeruginosa]